jgi:hypothetical protein
MATRLTQTSTKGGRLPDGFLRSARETFELADFTDGGSTTGTVDFADTIPLGAVVLRTLISNVTGFIGDTSATIQVGDGTDVDRYTTGTPSVFTTIAHLDAGAVSGTAYHAAEKTPKITVTSGSDFSAVTAGELTVEILYWFPSEAPNA